MKNLNSIVFLLICACFSAVLLVMSLYRSIETAGVNAFLTDTTEQIEALETENRVLRAKIESNFDIQIIDEYDRERLGMRAPTAEQIYFIRLVE